MNFSHQNHEMFSLRGGEAVHRLRKCMDSRSEWKICNYSDIKDFKRFESSSAMPHSCRHKSSDSNC